MFLIGKCFSSALRLQPLVLGYAVDWNKRQDDGCALDVGLELGVVAIGLHLTQLEAACTAEHHIHDADVSECGDDPLTYGAA